jgi:hypothetical protein
MVRVQKDYSIDCIWKVVQHRICEEKK